MSEIHVGDTGVALRFTVVDETDAAIDISTATTKDVLLKPPNNGALKTFAGAFVAGGTGGGLEYVTVTAADLDVAGTWERQVHLVLPGVGDFRTSVVRMEVLANLE